jgi:hypothetical protein
MLPRLKVIQVGDIHLARTAKIGRPIDDKDPRFPKDLRNLMAGPPIKAVFRTLHSILERDKIDCLTFMGDFAEQGGLGGFKSCVRYISESLQIGEGRRFESLTVGLVPGNHDIDRVLASKPGFKKKFQPLQSALSDVSLPSFPIDSPIWLKVQNDACRLDLALLNSCWGCGAKEFIPEEFRTEIFKAIDTAIKTGVSEKVTRAYYDRQFDTPAFADKTIQNLISDAAKIPGESLIISCAHHNILPQRLARLAPYTELVNGGALRNALLNLKRPIIYLHGHIHEDPVEIVQIPGGCPLVSISAPEASLGFNILEIVYTAAGLPLTCYLHPWRFDEAGVFRLHEKQVIPIKTGGRRRVDPALTAIYQNVVSHGVRYWPDLVECAAGVGADTPVDSTEEALEILTADRLVTIENYDLGREHWIVSSML